MPLRALALSMISSLLVGCAVLSPLPKKTDIGQRLAMFPTKDLPLRAPVTIHWDEHAIPFIEAENDHDLAFALGLVHAHLRLGQMELMRRIAQGRISEMAGPLTTEIDHSLRILDYAKAAEASEKAMPPETKAWVEAFVAGINHYQKTAKVLPAEFRILGLEREPWAVRDVLTVGRLASTDVNWLVWFSTLKLRKRKDWPQLWARLVKNGGDSMASFRHDREEAALDDILRGLSRSGSNSLAVAGSRTKTGAALMANDPHLGLMLPNLWLIAGIRSPSVHAVGLMVPGVPFVALGRNDRIAWGGTNMRAASSDLYDASKFKPDEIKSHKELIRVRWWPSTRVTVRTTPVGPIISDAPLLKAGGEGPLALRWVGHDGSDEITAFLRVQRAGNWEEFRQAFKTFAVSAQNMLYADVDGNIGQLMALRLPVRRELAPHDLVLDPTDPRDQWHGFLTVLDLPASYNPKAGFLASANNRPARAAVPVGYFFSTDDRVKRMAALMKGTAKIDLAALRAVQRDVYLISGVKLRDLIAEKIEALGVDKGLAPAEAALLELFRGWDGNYHVASRGALAFELVHHYLAAALRKRLYPPEVADVLANQSRNKALLMHDIEHAEAAALAADLKTALGEAAARIGEFKDWGAFHRLVVNHPLGRLPLIGGRFRFIDVPAEGSNDTLWKTAHSTTDERHPTRFGSNARHISDLSDPDANWFTLLGGQDGWFNSSTFTDQVPLWLKGEYVHVPFRIETVRKEFTYKTTLAPAAK
jgi:penicillin G amidase